LEGVPEETRAANPDGTTRYTRPLPGAARLYPETDIPPVRITRKMLKELRRSLPEGLEEKRKRFIKLGLHAELAEQVLRSERLSLFEELRRETKARPSLIASTLVSTLKDLRRKGVRVESLLDRHFFELFELVGRGRLVKEAIPEILSYLAEKPEKGVKQARDELGLKPLSRAELKELVRKVLREHKELPRKKLFGLVMARVRGRARAEDARKALGLG
jgi:glutamyl-tRNA(Gln) amidotransferase subunit E